MKEQENFPEKELNEMGASKLSDIKFKTMVIIILKELSEYFNFSMEKRNHKKEPVKNGGNTN